MGNIYRSSRGEVVDIDLLRISNENTIAIGNMYTNARGDELGPGGKVVKSKAQVMAEYHKLNTPMADDVPVSSSQAMTNNDAQKPLRKLATPMAEDTPVDNSYVKPRGSFAGAVAEEAEVKQELLEPKTVDGLKRI